MSGELHVVALGAGERIVFVHGGFGWGTETFPDQCELADCFRVLLVDRRGYGRSPSAGCFDFDSQSADIAELLDGGSHLVGSSYGGLLCLLAAARQPDAVRSLTVIEPPVFTAAPGEEAVERLAARLDRWYATAAGKGPEHLYAEFLEAMGIDPPSLDLGEWDRAAALATACEPAPTQAEVPFDLLAGTTFPKLVVSGAWDLAPDRARELAGRALGIVCDALEARLGAERAVLPGATHNPQLLGRPFNDRLRAFLAAA